jgi:glutamate synthase domain-containing protein 1
MMTRLNPRNGLPPAQGLYDPANEHDACGIGFVASISGHKSHDIIRKGIQVLLNLTHRGACGCDPETGDGAGVLIQIPHKFFARECEKLGFALPEPGKYGVGMIFLPVEKHPRLQCEGILERIVREEGLTVLGWRDTPVYASAIGRVARASQPYIQQIFIGCTPAMDEDAFERKLYVVRKRAENEIRESGVEDAETFYIPSLSCRTIVYKGLLLAPQITNFYRELSDPDVVTALCLVHQRFSTNTFPSWQRAHPYRYIAHNGEINTLRGNVNWMQARQSLLKSPLFGDDVKKLHPIIAPDGSDSANFDNVVELLLQGGRSLPHVMAMLIPEAWAGNPHMTPEKRAFYEYHACLMEPWDGPAAIAFTDGRVIGATLDRNGLRPGRYVVTHDDLVVMASEAGVLDIAPEQVKQKGRLQPGKMFLVDTGLTTALRGMAERESDHHRSIARAYAHAPSRCGDAPAPPASVRLHRRRSAHDPRPDGFAGRRTGWLHGHGYAVSVPFRQAPVAVQLFQATLRAGDQSAYRPHPRRDGDVAHQLHRQRAQHSRRGTRELSHVEAGAAAAHESRTGKAAASFEPRPVGHDPPRFVPRQRRRSRTPARSR